MLGIALLNKISQITSNPQANQITSFLTVAEGFDMKEVAFDLPSSITGISERDSVNLRGSFARRVNIIPVPGDIWSNSGIYLWDVYREVLESPILLAQLSESSDNDSQIKVARGIIGPPNEPTQQFQTFMEYKNKYQDLEQRLRQAKVTLINTTDPELKKLAQDDLDYYQRLLDDVEQEWIARGYKEEIEEALYQISEFFTSRPFRRWTSWKDDFSILNQQSDGYGPFWPTGYRPDKLFYEDNSWMKLTLSSSEVNSLINSAPQGLWRLRDTLGDNGRVEGDIEQVTMEIARVDIERTWFHPELLTSRFWKWQNPELPMLSDGAVPWPKGSLPAYIIGLVLVRNISITLKQKPQPGGHYDPGPPPCQPPDYCISVPFHIRVLGNLALTLDNLNEVGRSLPVEPLRGELLLRDRDIPFNDRMRELLRSSTTSVSISSDGGNVLLAAYIVQLSPKSPNPDPTLIWE